MKSSKKKSSPSRRAKKKSKRAASIRKGFEFQDFVAARSLLLMFEENGPVAVAMENRQGGTFDDVVEYYPDRTVWKQVKWAANPLSEPYTIDVLAKPLPRRNRSLIKSLAESWHDLKQRGQPFQVQLVSNRQPDDDLRAVLGGDPPRVRTDLSNTRQDRLTSAWQTHTELEQAEFDEFVHSIELHLGYQSLDGLRRDVVRVLNVLHTRTGTFERLMRAVQSWSTDASKDKIFIDDVTRVLGVSGGIPDNRFRIDQTTLITRKAVHAPLAEIVQNSKGKYVVVLGAPGSGKSTALNSIGPKSSLAARSSLVLYNCFTGTGDSHVHTRACAVNFLKFLLREMHRIASGRWARQFAETHEMESVIAEAAGIAPEGAPLVIIVDGLDYAAANKTEGEPALFDSLPRQLPDNVTFIVSAQTKNQLPSHLQGLDHEQYYQLPLLTRDQVRRMLAKHQLLKPPSRKSSSDEEMLLAAVVDCAGGHPLCTQYLCRRLRDSATALDSLAGIAKALPPYGPDIHDWYGRLPGLQDAYARALLAEISACPFPLTAHEANSLVRYPKNPYDAENALERLSFLFHRRGDEWLFLHDSLRMHVSERAGKATGSPGRYFEMLINLKNDPRIGEYVLQLSISVDKRDWAFSTVDGNWLADRLAEGARLDMIRRGLLRLLEDAVEREEWPKAAKWALYVQRIDVLFDEYVDWSLTGEVWLACDQPDLLLRRVIEAEQLLVSPVRAFSISELLERFGHAREAAYINRLAVSTPLDLPNAILWRDWEHHVVPYIRSLAVRLNISDCTAEINRIIRLGTEEGKLIALERPKGLFSNLCEAGAFACLWHEQFAKVLRWCSNKRAKVSTKSKTLLHAAVALMTKNRSTAEVCTALANEPPLWLIRLAGRSAGMKNQAAQAMKRRSAPCTLLQGGSAMYEEEQVESAVRDLYDEVRLCAMLCLNERLDGIMAAIPSHPMNKGELLYGLTARTASSLIAREGELDWQNGSAALTTTMGAGFFEMPAHERFTQIGVGQSLVFLLRQVAAIARISSSVDAFASWLLTEFVPLMSGAGFEFDRSLRPTLLDVYVAVAGDRALSLFLDELEQEDDQRVAHKSFYYQTAAVGASQFAAKERAKRLLQKGFRAAITYDYRKDTTILSFIEGIASLAKELGSKLLHYAAQAGATLEILRDLTDHDELRCAGSDLISAVTCGNAQLAARVAALLKTRGLDEVFSRRGIADSLRLRGVDPDSVNGAFRHEGAAMTEGHGHIDHITDTRTEKLLPETLGELLKEHETRVSGRTSSAAFGDLRELEQAMLNHVQDKDSFDQVKNVFAGRSGWFTEMRLARAAHDVGLTAEAKNLINEACDKALSDRLWFWTFDRIELVSVATRLVPGKGIELFQIAARRMAASHPELMGFSFVEALICVLRGNGQVDDALKAFEALATHLRDLMRPYPSYAVSEKDWRSALTASGP